MASTTKISKWIRATLIGPFATCWGVVTAASVLLPSEAFSRIFFDVDSWALGMWLVSLFASAVAVCLIATDVLFLKWKLRQLPTSLFSSMLAPIAVWIVWFVMPSFETIPLLVASLAAGLWIGAASVRFVFGKRP